MNDLTIHYLKKGTGKAILILPGWGTTIDTYLSLINAISHYATIYCLDMPGFGESEEPKQSWSIDDYVDFIIHFIQEQGIKQIELIGHSNGGRIIIKLVNKQDLPFEINKIILMESAGIVHEKKNIQKLKLKSYKFGKKILEVKFIKSLFPNAMEILKNTLGSEDYKNASPIMRQTLVNLVNEDLKGYLSKIRIPTLLIWGTKDTATPMADAKIMEALIPDAGLVEIKNGSHFAFLEYPTYINKIIYHFVKEDV